MASASKIEVDQSQFLDPRWRLSNLYYITDEKGQRVKFTPNDAQLKLMGDLHHRNIILKARQLGFTTFCCLIYLDAGIFNPNTRAGVIAHKLDDAKVIFRDKVKFPYDNLDEGLKAQVHAKQDSADTLTLANNSSIRVSTSMRSGTLQYLHISEFGKICSQYPEKAREIVTGALAAVHGDQFVVIESTAEGQEGRFYQMVQEARALEAAGTELTQLDYKFHFFPWYQDGRYKLDAVPLIANEDQEYFDKLEADLGIEISREQRGWYVKTAQTMGGDMKREYPSTPDEAFEQALEGAYFSKELLIAAKQKRIGGFPLVPSAPVNTFWDLGRNDFTTIWLHQHVDGFNRFVGYYENSGEYISHYIAWIREWARDNNAVFGDHYLPHDGDRQSLWLPEGTMKVMSDLNFRPKIVKRPQNKIEAINVARGKFASCQFDEAGCFTGIKRLKMYRKEWDDLRGVWKDRPHHDDASHGADGFMTFTCSNYQPPKPPSRGRYGASSSHSPSWMGS